MQLIDLQVLEAYFYMVVLINAIIAAAFTPLINWLKCPKLVLMYLAWALGAFVIWATGLNIFAALIPDPLIGQIFTAIAVGRGANLFHDLTDHKPVVK